jgi:hypothetical protein
MSKYPLRQRQSTHRRIAKANDSGLSTHSPWELWNSAMTRTESMGTFPIESLFSKVHCGFISWRYRYRHWRSHIVLILFVWAIGHGPFSPFRIWFIAMVALSRCCYGSLEQRPTPLSKPVQTFIQNYFSRAMYFIHRRPALGQHPHKFLVGFAFSDQAAVESNRESQQNAVFRWFLAFC